MQLARVVGDVVTTIKDPALTGIALLVIQPIASSGEAVGRSLVAVDSIGAGVGETVFFVRGKEASFPFYPPEIPADAGIVGIVDHWTVAPAAAAANDEDRGERNGALGAPRAMKKD